MDLVAEVGQHSAGFPLIHHHDGSDTTSEHKIIFAVVIVTDVTVS